MEQLREIGTVKWFDSIKSYGFISRPPGDDLFVHSSRIVGEYPRQGDRVSFLVAEGRKGKIADDVRVERDA